MRMKANKKNRIKHQILQILLENEWFSASSIARLLNLSEKNVRGKIDELNDVLRQKNLGEIIKVPGKGSLLKADSEQRKALSSLYGSYEVEDIVNGEYRLYVYLRILLSRFGHRLTVAELSELTYDSLPVCKKNLETCAQWLKMFSIDLSVRRNYGIDLEGQEVSCRLAIKHLVINDKAHSIEANIRYFAKGINLELLSECIDAVEKSWNFSFTEESYNSILLFAALAVTRSDMGLLQLKQEEKDIVVKYNEYELSQSLFKQIEEKFMIQIDDEEVKYFAIQLLCSQMIHNGAADLEYGVRDYDKKTKEFVQRIISVVSNIMNVDLTMDHELYYGLLNHIRPAVFRMKFEKHSTANLTSFIQEEYRKTYRVSWALSILFEEYYGIQISSTELSYITLYIQASLDRLEPPLTILLITELGMGLNQMFCNKIKLAIPKIKEIKILSLHDLDVGELAGYDLIISTSALPVQDERIVYIESLLSGHGIEELKEKIEYLKKTKINQKSHFDVSCHTLFDPRLILIHPAARDKKELLRKMTDRLLACGAVSEKYLGTVLEREGAVSTCIGNGVAIPHGYANYVNQSRVVVAVLKDAMQWNEEEQVRLVFLLGLRVNTRYESEKTQLFYKSFLEMIDTEQDVSELCRLSQEELYKFLVR